MSKATNKAFVEKYIPAPILAGLSFLRKLLNWGSELSGGAFSKGQGGLGDGGQSGPKK